ncbi:glycosyltransferase family 4 protein [Dyadobacter sp. CY326]|uniref:glycosyltransferase family 4 protein n=1 Tax=Dyadobacter sp. CY326 TaxID=2907300 RepID=UPI001F3A3D4F|nr:glycosyltransferase family 4 protein [Dyadobacter sp. CY326]MCE7065372.1 glycosyltransferase family 4 protein [Dyadobacter sp. CY326]
MIKSKKLAVVGFSGLSGATQVGLNFAGGVDIPKEDTIFIFYGKTESVNSGYIDELNSFGINHHFAKKTRPKIDLPAEFQVFRFLQRHKPKNVLLASSAPIFGILAYKLLNFFRSNIITIEQHPLNLTSIKEYLHSYIGFAFFEYVVPASQAYAEGFSQKMSPLSKIFARKLVVVPNGLNIPARTTSAETLANKQTIKLGMAARFDDCKDFETVLRATAKLNASGSIKYIFEIAGDGPNRAKIEKLVDELQLRPYVAFHGLLSKTSMKAFYQNVDIYIQSTTGEAMSISMLEAMGYGLIFLGTRVRGVQEFIIPKKNGLLFECGNADDLVDKIESIVSNPALAKALAAGARTHYENNFSLSNMVNGYSKLLKI